MVETDQEFNIFWTTGTKKTLGDWINTADKIRTRYQAYRTENQIYERKDNHFIKSDITEYNTLAENKSTVRTLPENAIPCRVPFRNAIGTPFQRKSEEIHSIKPQSTSKEVI
jgi:hypothetical protein